MIWGYIGLFFIATVKYITAPFFGLAVPGDTFFYTWAVVVSGGIFSTTLFYYLADYFMERARKKRLEKGVVKRKFTRLNKYAVRVKQKVGIIGFSLLSAAVLSIPIGSIISAKFFGHKKSTIFFLYGGVIFVGTIMTFIAYLF